jgi:xanthine/CO dehydrogenase XdhC/CoxF family maturation factor
MKELDAILDAWETSDILATVVGIRGSAYRRPGARMLIKPDGRRIGSVSGGCLEGDLVKRARGYTEEGPVVRTYNGLEFGLGCNGSVDVLVERLDTPAAQSAMAALAHRPCVIATILSGPDLGERIPPAQADRRDDVFVERVPAPVQLTIFGVNHDVAPLAALAKSLGWRVSAYAPRPTELPPIDNQSIVVLMTHSYQADLDLLGQLLPRRPRYLGLLGPRARAERLLTEVDGDYDLSCLHAPVGLDIGGHDPETIALSIAAEIQAMLAGKLRAVSQCDSRTPSSRELSESLEWFEPVRFGLPVMRSAKGNGDRHGGYHGR